jgi:hypothetical protein
LSSSGSLLQTRSQPGRQGEQQHPHRGETAEQQHVEAPGQVDRRRVGQVAVLIDEDGGPGRRSVDRHRCQVRAG